MLLCLYLKEVEKNMDKNGINILFTSSGRRVSLIKKFRETFHKQHLCGKIFTADIAETAPTAFFSDQHFLVPRVTEENYIDELLNICEEACIDLLIPLIDTELELLAKNKMRFKNKGVTVMVSDHELVQISNDKEKTFEFLSNHHISTPKVYREKEIEDIEDEFPLLIKPRDGSSSKGVTKIHNKEELKFFKTYIPNAIIQEYVFGEEYTIDVMVDFGGNIKTIVPRLRIETRAGEVSKGVTIKDKNIIHAVKDLVQILPGAIGCITLQCFKKENGEITFIEINPRFGGGIPLSIEAGADFPLWTIQMGMGIRLEKLDLSWEENLSMLRYDEAIFTERILYANKIISV